MMRSPTCLSLLIIALLPMAKLWVLAHQLSAPCALRTPAPIPLAPMQSRVYRVGVLANRGVERAVSQYQMTFGDYLTTTVGPKFDPPISFEMVPVPISEAPIDELPKHDYVFANPAIASCIDSEVGLKPLVSLVSKRKRGDEVVELSQFGGVIFTQAGNTEVNNVQDLKDKRVAALGLSAFGGAQMQFREMIRAGLHHLQDPKQILFCETQGNIVKAVLDGKADVGFVRTDQLEQFIDPATDQVLDLSKVKIIRPLPEDLADGTPFPFIKTTQLYPEWPFSSTPDVSEDIDLEVQKSLLELSQHASAASALLECYEQSNCTSSPLLDEDARNDCEEACFHEVHPVASESCLVDRETILLADLSKTAAKNAGWRPSLSYMTIRNLQREIDFLQRNDEGNFQCVRAKTLADAVVCPQGHFKKNENDIDTSCEDLGMSCHGYKCVCKPCVKAFDVDFSSASTTAKGGCDKFEMCGTVQQSDVIAFTAVDNRKRPNATFEVKVHVEEETELYPMQRVDGNSSSEEVFRYQFEFDATDRKTGFLIMEVTVTKNGETEQIPQSPFRLEVQTRDCQEATGDSLRVADESGNCVCKTSSVEIGSSCISLAVLLPAIIVPIVVLLAIVITCIVIKNKVREDLLWKITKEEIAFGDPPTILGKGHFGAVYLASYRGAQVAVKQIRYANQGVSNNPSIHLKQGGTLIPLLKARVKSEFDQDETSTSTTELGDIETGFGNKSCLFVAHPQSSHSSPSTALTGRAFTHSSSMPSSSPSPTTLKREIKILSKLRHPNIVTVMGAVVDPGGQKMIVMEYMELKSLTDVLQSRTMAVDDTMVLSMVQDVARGVQYLHATTPCIVHGDIKASNVLVDSMFRAKVADFGLSASRGSSHARVARGTPFWMAPELLHGLSGNTTMSDVYSFGVFLYEAYKRQYPYAGEDAEEVLRLVAEPTVNKRPPIPSRCPQEVAEAMEACYRADPNQRPTSSEVSRMMESITKDGSRVQSLLWELFPRHVAAAIREGRTVEPENHETVTVLVSRIEEHETLEAEMSPAKFSSLLSRLYKKFDNLCDLHNVFRLEEVGNGFMCTTNLAESQPEHARIMAAFAADALKAAACTLLDDDDPSQGFVSIKIGFASGPVVSHVVGTRSPRFAIIGKTVNLATKLQTFSKSGRALCSEHAVDFLREQDPYAQVECRGRISLTERDQVVAYWVGDIVLPSTQNAAPVRAAPSKVEDSLIEWNVDVLSRVIKEIVASRRDPASTAVEPGDFRHLTCATGTVFEEVKEVVPIPSFDADTVRRVKEHQGIVLPAEVTSQLKDLVTNIAGLYNEDVPFHNFEHASHVTLSVVRLLSRIKTVPSEGQAGKNDAEKTLHQCSYGIASDPVTQAAIIFSSLMHDLGHEGVPNAQLVKEDSEVAVRYKGRSVAEQHSFDVGYGVFMSPKYEQLRRTIAHTEEEAARFRQMVINCVLATDIVDQELKRLRNNRWDKAFSGENAGNDEAAVNRKATIVIEHIMQASDIAHTFQQWHTYRKWNQRFFLECYKAWKEGRADKDPSIGWYKGEIAKKLRDSGVFGVYGDEYVQNAVANREEWVLSGQDAVAEMMTKANRVKRSKSIWTRDSKQLSTDSENSEVFVRAAASSEPNRPQMEQAKPARRKRPVTASPATPLGGWDATAEA
ncbi:Ephrin type-B receptor 3 (Fragment) [Seminavis robusta]|uniref:guanylate cyclase n=1 Tax=Seminavis robusta TaxID=568900 RepID=A0A9N8HJT6_9STRA